MKTCFHCKQLKQEAWKLIKKKYKDNEDITILEIDSSLLKSPNFFIKTKISGFPTIAILQGDKLIKIFSKERTFLNLEKFILSI